MKYIVDHGLPGSVGGCNTVDDLYRYLDSDPRPGYRLSSTLWINGNFLIVWEQDESEQNVKILTEACKMALRKHTLDDQSIGWEQLDDVLNGALSKVMGEKEYDEWMEQVSPEKTT